jgi:alpha-1,6-mannosyltransferase
VERHARRAGNVHFTGAIHDRDLLAAYYASADVFVHGCVETYGFAIAEAISSGVRVVVPDRGGAADFAARGGMKVYKTGDAMSCAHAILATLEEKSGDPCEFEIRSLDEHFASLFALYSELVAAKSVATAPA